MILHTSMYFLNVFHCVSNILTYFNVSWPFFLHSWARDPGLGPKAAAGRAQAGPAARPGARAQECRKNWKDTCKYVKIYKNTMRHIGKIHYFPII